MKRARHDIFHGPLFECFIAMYGGDSRFSVAHDKPNCIYEGSYYVSTIHPQTPSNTLKILCDYCLCVLDVPVVSITYIYVIHSVYVSTPDSNSSVYPNFVFFR